MPQREKFLTAEEAASHLGVSRATLYAYVSRGLIRASETAGDPRRHLYSLHDIDELKRRKSLARRPGEIAAGTLSLGLPVLSSGITLIADGRLSYRGRDAGEWSKTATLEETARLLWDCGSEDPFAGAEAPPAWDGALLQKIATLPLTDRCQALMPLVAAGQMITWQRDARHLWNGAGALMRAVAGAASATQPATAPIHEHLAAAWRLDGCGADIVRRALVLIADHELNASAFAVRVVASTGASLGACLNAGLGALSGPLHGGTTSLVEILLEEVDRMGDASAVAESRLRRGDGVPGFGHPLYPNGDPRAGALLPLLPADPARDAFAEVMERTTGKLPNVDFALVALRRTYRLPPGAALALFAIGRTAGWIAHALEQRRDDKLIRPRARYTGPSVAQE